MRYIEHLDDSRIARARLKLWKKMTVGIASFTLISIGVVIIFVFSLPNPCANEVLAESLSPNKKMKSITFQRYCGATTGFSAQVSVLPVSANLADNKGGNVFSADTNHGIAPSGLNEGPEVKIRWLSDAKLRIQHHRSARIFLAEPHANGVQIEYAILQ